MEIIDLGNGESGILLTSNVLLIMSLCFMLLLVSYWYWKLAKKTERLVAIGKNGKNAIEDLNKDLRKEKEQKENYKGLYDEFMLKYKKEKEKTDALTGGVKWVKG